MLLLGVPAFLILVQPDLGTCIMVVLCGLTVMFLAGLPLWLFVAPVVAIGVAAPIVYSMLHGYQRKRIDTFLDPESDPLGSGYHIAQSKIAIGSGGIWGKGYLNGSQSHLDYLPEGHTDFAFAALAEEWGLVGGSSSSWRSASSSAGACGSRRTAARASPSFPRPALRPASSSTPRSTS